MIIFSKISENITYYHLVMLCVFKVWGESHCWIDIPKIRCWSRLKEELSEWVPKVRCRIWWGGLDKTRWECIVGDGWKFWWRMSKQCEGMKRRSETYVSCFTIWNILHALNVPRPVCLCGCSWWSTVWRSSHSMELSIGSRSPAKQLPDLELKLFLEV